MTSEAPEQVWLKEGYNSWGQYGDWWYVASKGDGVEYVRADLVEELEAKLAKALEALDVDLIEQAISDVLSEGGTYRDAAEYVACTTIAELKGDKTQ